MSDVSSGSHQTATGSHEVANAKTADSSAMARDSAVSGSQVATSPAFLYAIWDQPSFSLEGNGLERLISAQIPESVATWLPEVPETRTSAEETADFEVATCRLSGGYPAATSAVIDMPADPSSGDIAAKWPRHMLDGSTCRQCSGHIEWQRDVALVLGDGTSVHLQCRPAFEAERMEYLAQSRGCIDLNDAKPQQIPRHWRQRRGAAR